jgi:hypothetical protein
MIYKLNNQFLLNFSNSKIFKYLLENSLLISLFDI